MQLRKRLIPNSLFLHMRSFEIAQMSQILLGGKKGERDVKSRNPPESYQWFAFCGWGHGMRLGKDEAGIKELQSWRHNLGEHKVQKGNNHETCYHKLSPEVGTHNCWSPYNASRFREVEELVQSEQIYKGQIQSANSCDLQFMVHSWCLLPCMHVCVWEWALNFRVHLVQSPSCPNHSSSICSD